MTSRMMRLTLRTDSAHEYSVTLRDDGYRIYVSDYHGPYLNVGPAELSLMAYDEDVLGVYKQFDFPGIGRDIIDRIWKALLACGGVMTDPDDAAREEAWTAPDCEAKS